MRHPPYWMEPGMRGEGKMTLSQGKPFPVQLSTGMEHCREVYVCICLDQAFQVMKAHLSR